MIAMFFASLSVVSAHVWAFDQSFTNYTLTYNVVNNSLGSVQSYDISAEFVLCKKNMNTMHFSVDHKGGVGWCIGSPSKCCAGGINETTGECNTNSCGIAYTQSCSIFGKTDPIKNCYRSCMMYPQEAANYEQILGTPLFVGDHSLCQQYGVGNTGAWISRKNFTVSSLANSVISAGMEFRYNGLHDHDDDGYTTVPILAKLGNIERPIINCTEDSDCDTSTMCYESDNYCSTGNDAVLHDFVLDKCVNPGQFNSYCTKYPPQNTKIATCFFGCSDGECNIDLIS